MLHGLKKLYNIWPPEILNKVQNALKSQKNIFSLPKRWQGRHIVHFHSTTTPLINPSDVEKTNSIC